jgi:broad specificity phosphatase PhoE
MEKFPKNLTFVRHGDNVVDVDSANNNLQLSRVGVEQSEWVKQFINKLDIVFTSPAERTIETGYIIGQNVEQIEDARLLEKGWGAGFEGGGENEERAKQRIGEFLDEIGEKYEGQNVLVVAHGGIIKLAEENLENVALPNRNIENCSIIHYSTTDNEIGRNANYLRYKKIAKPFDNEMRAEIVKKGVNVYFVRHGESTSNRDGILAGGSDFPLTDLGVKQAEKVADELYNLNVKFDNVFTSPLSRSADTAKIIAQRLGISEDKIITLDELTGCGGGDLEGKPYSDWYNVPAEKLTSEHGAESYVEQRRRIGRAIVSILNNTELDSNALIISHSSVFQVLQALNDDIIDEKETFEQDKPAPGSFKKTVL